MGIESGVMRRLSKLIITVGVRATRTTVSFTSRKSRLFIGQINLYSENVPNGLVERMPRFVEISSKAGEIWLRVRASRARNPTSTTRTGFQRTPILLPYCTGTGNCTVRYGP